MKKFFTVLLCYCLAFQPAFAALNDVEKAQSGQTQLLPNPGFENGLSSITATDLTDVAHVTSGTNLLDGKGSITWNSDGASQTLTFCATVPEGYEGRNGAAGFKMILTPSGTATHTIKITDGTNDLVSAETITSSTSPQSAIRNFIFATTGTACVVLTSVAADEPLIAIDNGFMGLASDYNVSSVSQATFVGGMENAGASTCTYAESTSTGVTDYDDLGTGSSCAAWTVVSNGPGTISAQGTNDHRLVYTNMPPGNYKFEVTGLFYRGAAGTCLYRLSDGTNTYQTEMESASANAGGTGSLTFHVSVTTAATRTYKIQAADDHASSCVWYNYANYPASWKIYRFPTSSEQAYTPDTTNWRVDANLAGSTNFALGSSNQTAYIGMTNSGITLTNNATATTTAQVPCATTTAPSGTTCTAADESNGVAFTIPRAGTYEACVEFAHQAAGSGTPVVAASFQIVETPTNAQTISQEGKSRVSSGIGTASNMFFPHNLCGTFKFDSVGQKVLRLMYEQSITATVATNEIIADGNTSLGQRDIHWTVKPLDQSLPAPVLTNMVTTGSSGGVRVEYVNFGGATEGTNNCTSTPCTIYRSSGGVSSVTRTTTGQYVINFSPAFSAPPVCSGIATQEGAGVGHPAQAGAAPTTSTFTVYGYGSTGVNVDVGRVNMTCIGPR